VNTVSADAATIVAGVALLVIGLLVALLLRGPGLVIFALGVALVMIGTTGYAMTGIQHAAESLSAGFRDAASRCP
jgi:asparagine N-glycosylation enzyme membrane subunit Stt3